MRDSSVSAITKRAVLILAHERAVHAGEAELQLQGIETSAATSSTRRPIAGSSSV